MTLQEELIMLVNNKEECARRTTLWQERYNSTGNVIGIQNTVIQESMYEPASPFGEQSNRIWYGFKSTIFPDLPMRYIRTRNEGNLNYMYYSFLSGDDNYSDFGYRNNGLMLYKSFELLEKGYISGFLQDNDDNYSDFPGFEPINRFLRPICVVSTSDKLCYDKFISINNNLKQLFTDSKPFSFIPVYTSDNSIIAVYNKHSGIFEYVGGNLDLIKENEKIKDVYCLNDTEVSNFTFPEFFYNSVDVLIYSKSTGICLNNVEATENLINL